MLRDFLLGGTSYGDENTVREITYLENKMKEERRGNKYEEIN